MRNQVKGEGEPSTDDGSDPSLIMSISPEPTRDERDAIVAALVVLARRSEPSDALAPPPTSRWQAVARREAVRADQQDQVWR